MKYHVNQIIVCSTDSLYGMVEQKLIVGDKYEIIDVFDMSEDKTILEVRNINTGLYGIFDSRCFISLDVYREWKLRKIIE